MTPLSHTSSHLDRALYVWRTTSLHAALHPFFWWQCFWQMLHLVAEAGTPYGFSLLSLVTFATWMLPHELRRVHKKGRVCSRFLMSTANGA